MRKIESATVTPRLCFTGEKFLRKYPYWCWDQLYNDPAVHTHWPPALKASQPLPWQWACLGLKALPELPELCWGQPLSPPFQFVCAQLTQAGRNSHRGQDVSPCLSQHPHSAFSSFGTQLLLGIFLNSKQAMVGRSKWLRWPSPICEQQQRSNVGILLSLFWNLIVQIILSL